MGAKARLFFIIPETHHVVGRTAEDPAQLFQSQQSNVLVFLQRIQGFVVDAGLQEPVLAYAPLLHGFPQWAEIDHGDHLGFGLNQRECVWGTARETLFWSGQFPTRIKIKNRAQIQQPLNPTAKPAML